MEPSTIHSASSALELSIDDDESRVRAFQGAAFAQNTVTAYKAAWTSFADWCYRRGYLALPAEPMVVAKYLAHAASLIDSEGTTSYAPATIRVWLAAINKAHEHANFPGPGAHPEVKLTMAGISRHLARPVAQKAPLLLEDMQKLAAAIDFHSFPAGVIGHRDWAMLLWGFVGAYRRSELASFVLGDVRRSDTDGLLLALRRSKTDQTGAGLLKALPYGKDPITCSPCAFVRWVRILALADAGPNAIPGLLGASDLGRHVCRTALPELSKLDPSSPIFRPVRKNGTIEARGICGEVVNAAVHRRVSALGYDSSQFGAHSLRAGFVTQAFRDGATHHEVMRQTGHKSPTVVEAYSRERNPLLHNAVTRMAL